MSQRLQFEIDPLKISDDFLGGVLVSIDVLAFSPDEYPQDTESPVCLISVAHTTGLSSISKVYTKTFITGSASIIEEGQIIRDLTTYLDMFESGTIAAHYGCGESLDEGFDIPYLKIKVKKHHPELYSHFMKALVKFKPHDTCLYVKRKMNLPSAELDYVESYYGLIRTKDAELDADIRSSMANYWRNGQMSIIKHSVTNVYNCLRIAQSQIRKSVCCTDIPL
jgi:DNA polymerase elongation subunit (family B)